MAYTHEDIIAKHQKIHDMLLDKLEELTRIFSETGAAKGLWNAQGMVEKEWTLLCAVEDRAKAAGTAKKDTDDTPVVGWEDLDV